MAYFTNLSLIQIYYLYVTPLCFKLFYKKILTLLRIDLGMYRLLNLIIRVTKLKKSVTVINYFKKV